MVLPKAMRLKGHRCFDHLYREGVRYHEHSILLRVVKAEPRLQSPKSQALETKTCKCAISISSKVNKKAVVRNRMRRVLHKHLQDKLSRSSQHANKWILFSLKPKASNMETSVLLKECDRLLLKAGLIK